MLTLSFCGRSTAYMVKIHSLYVQSHFIVKPNHVLRLGWGLTTMTTTTTTTTIIFLGCDSIEINLVYTILWYLTILNFLEQFWTISNFINQFELFLTVLSDLKIFSTIITVFNHPELLLLIWFILKHLNPFESFESWEREREREREKTRL